MLPGKKLWCFVIIYDKIFFQVHTQPSNPYTFYRSDNATDPVDLEEMRNSSEEVLPVQGSVVGMFLKTDDDSVIPVENTDELIRIEIPNKEERQINVRLNANYFNKHELTHSRFSQT